MDKIEHEILPGVLVVGGGYAGMHAVRGAEREGAAVTLVDAAEDHSFLTRLAAVAGGTSPESDASIPLDTLAGSVLSGRVTSVGDGWVRLEDGRVVRADAVVVTTGARAARPPIPGLEHAATLQSAADALQLRNSIAAAEAVVVVGGGASGVQLAAATARAHPAKRVHLVESGPSLLPGMAPTLGRNAVRILRDRGVQIHLETFAEEIRDDGVLTSSGWIPGLPVWVGGFAADASALGLPVDDTGRIAVNADLSVESMERTFAAGDIAAHRDGRGNRLPMSAQVAVRAGTGAGRNAARHAAGKATRPVGLAQLGWVMDLGGGRGLAELGPLPLTTVRVAGRRVGLPPVPLAAPLLDLVPPLLHDAIDVKNVLEIAGLEALLPWHPRFSAWPGSRLGRALAPIIVAGPAAAWCGETGEGEYARAA